MVDKYEVGRAYEAANKYFGWGCTSKAGIQIKTNDANIYGRYAGRAELKVTDLINYSEALGLDPCQVFDRLMVELSGRTWADLGKKIDASPAVAKRRFEIAKNRYGLNDEQLWTMINGEQIDI